MPQVSCLRIVNWDKHFENNRTREMREMAWVPVPNKQDGDGYTELIDHHEGPAHYGAWIALLHVASKCQPRGTLLRDAPLGPHTMISLARMTRFPTAVLEAAVARLKAIGWVEAISLETKESQDGAEKPQEGAPSRARRRASVPFPSVPITTQGSGHTTHGQLTPQQETVRLVQEIYAEMELKPPKGGQINRWANMAGGTAPLLNLLSSLAVSGKLGKGEGYVAGCLRRLEAERKESALPEEHGKDDPIFDGFVFPDGRRYSTFHGKAVPAKAWAPAAELKRQEAVVVHSTEQEVGS